VSGTPASWKINRYTHWLGVGARCFRWREYKDATERMTLDWIWINPFIRRDGILSTYWEGFRHLSREFLGCATGVASNAVIPRQARRVLEVRPTVQV
jgi:hypothetical protein